MFALDPFFESTLKMSLKRLIGRIKSIPKGQDIDKEDEPKNNIKTWSDRLIDKENYWITAINMEEDGKLIDALQFYIKDAIKSLELSLYNKAALSCSCSAICLEKIKNFHYARIFHMQAATLYEYNAGYILGDSIRESLWSLKEAYEHYMFAREFDNAKIIYERYITLSMKTNPFSQLETRKDPATEKFIELERYGSESSLSSNSNSNSNNTLQIQAENTVPLHVIQLIAKFSRLKNQSISGIDCAEKNISNINVEEGKNKKSTIVRGSPF